MDPSWDRQRQPRLQTAVDFVRRHCDQRPSVAIILGSGLGGLAQRIESPTSIPYAEVPGMQVASAGGHRGQFVLGRLESTRVIAMAGRLHRYEGYRNDQVAFPVRLMSSLGATRLIVSNAAGGVSPKLQCGDIVIIRDHIDLLGGNYRWNRRKVPVLTHGGGIYDLAMSRTAMNIAVERQFTAHFGTYLATLGPTYETRSEYRMMRKLGADVVGMSTIPEVLAAYDEKMRVLGLSMVSNIAQPDRPEKTDHNQVLQAGLVAEVKMEAIVRGALQCK